MRELYSCDPNNRLTRPQRAPTNMILIRQSATDDWIERFGELIENHDIDCNDTNRLRVAILDTGIDINHPMILQDSRIKECKSWTGTPADKDSSGHGTHIANSILDLTRNVDIYIAKITENNILENADHIAEVSGSRILSYTHFISLLMVPILYPLAVLFSYI